MVSDLEMALRKTDKHTLNAASVKGKLFENLIWHAIEMVLKIGRLLPRCWSWGPTVSLLFRQKIDRISVYKLELNQRIRKQAALVGIDIIIWEQNIVLSFLLCNWVIIYSLKSATFRPFPTKLGQQL